MKKDLKNAVKYAFEVPQPVRKKTFVRKFSKKKISNYEFMLIQAGYIRKGVWIFSVFILALMLTGIYGLKKDMLCAVSSLLPFAALLAVAENARSVTWQMAEMEKASRFSLKSVLLARMGAVGAVHLILLVILIFLGRMHGAGTFLETGVTMLLPYFAAAASGLWITRKFRGKEAVYGCAGITVLISGINLAVTSGQLLVFRKILFQEKAVMLFILLILTVWEYKQSVQRTEDLVWGL